MADLDPTEKKRLRKNALQKANASSIGKASRQARLTLFQDHIRPEEQGRRNTCKAWRRK
jgi:hypothetical protein